MAGGDGNVVKGPPPPDLSSVQLSLLPDPTGDSPPSGVKFGDIKVDTKSGPFKAGDRVNATFWSANPRYDLLTEGTFAVVEMQRGEKWIPVFDDDDFCLYFKWDGPLYSSDSSMYGLATIEWDVPKEAGAGVYRLRHFGSFKTTEDAPVKFFTGASSGFTIVN